MCAKVFWCSRKKNVFLGRNNNFFDNLRFLPPNPTIRKKSEKSSPWGWSIFCEPKEMCFKQFPSGIEVFNVAFENLLVSAKVKYNFLFVQN